MNYEEARAWLESWADKYFVNCQWHVNGKSEIAEPEKIILTVYKEQEHFIGYGNTFSEALEAILDEKNIDCPLLEKQS